MTTIRLNDVTKQFDDGTVAVNRLSFEAKSSEFLVLLGPSGCGKSTALRMIAGLETITSGELYLDGHFANDVPPRDRDIAMVFQSFALYPYLNVRENIAFPLKLAKAPKDVIEERVGAVSQALGLRDFLHRKPGTLSGGQRQRVAMARAIVRRPSMFLMDEPLSNLDAGLRVELRTEITALTRDLGVTTIYVTHDQTEALTMADRIAVMRNGILQQIDTPDNVYQDPATVFVAAFLGTPRMNLLQGSIHAYLEEQLLVDLGAQALALPWEDPRSRRLARHHQERVIFGVRPEALEIVTHGTAGPDRGLLSGWVRHLEHLGHETLAYVDTGSTPVRLDINGTGEDDLDHQDAVGEDGQTRSISRIAKVTLERFRGGRRDDDPRERPIIDGRAPGEPGHRSRSSDLVVRVDTERKVRTGEQVQIAVDLTRIFVFDRMGYRIHTGPAVRMT
ncbi:MAG: multiple sugar transport system ATP-binding protein [Cryptosporangiaceae bacterium]|nr:multiple sugar transport system ATP-binding protein [Cryptosporangiaceae bacterium]